MLLTVREVATALRVCTATVYQMVEREELEYVRVSNAIRIVIREWRNVDPHAELPRARHEPGPK